MAKTSERLVQLWPAQGVRRYIGPKRIVILLFFSACLLVLWYLRKEGLLTHEELFRVLRDHPVSAPLIFVGFYILSMIFFVPTLPLNIGAGILWGAWMGSILATIGGGSGAIAAFWLSRTSLGQPLARSTDNRLICWLQTELETKGWKVVALTRLLPVFPAGPLNVAFSLTAIRFTTYCWATMVFLYPFALVFAYIGNFSGKLILQGQAAGLVETIMVISLGLVALYGLRIMKRLGYGKMLWGCTPAAPKTVAPQRPPAVDEPQGP